MNQRQFEALIADADHRLSQLKVQYEQWFSGVERLEPVREREALSLLLRRLRTEQPANTASRFRVEQLNQRYLTYGTYWRRIARQIEEGTYRRDQLKVKRKRERTAQPQPSPTTRLEFPDPADIDVDVETALLEATRAIANPPQQTTLDGAKALRRPQEHPQEPATSLPRPPTPAAAPVVVARPGAPRRPNASAAGLSDTEVRAIYDRYVEARRKNRESTDNVDLATIARNLRSALPKLAVKHAGKRIDFVVVLKEGKVALKPVAR